MFFYISFLRPPPTQSPPPNQIHITPQVSNDLRTEPYKFSQDIYYSWIGPLQGLVSSKKTIATTKATVKKATKLTVYRTSSAFKEISVPPPTGVRDGQQWQLVLAPSPDVLVNYSIDLFDENIGSGMPFPVTSMPILFSSKGLGGKRVLRKQERIQRVYRISNGGGETEGNSIEGSSPRELRITEQTSFDLDKKIWDSGIGLSSWLIGFHRTFHSENQSNAPLRMLWDRLFSSKQRHIVELGAGTGIVSLTLASLRPRSASTSASDTQMNKIIVTDLESAIPLLNHNISSNQFLYPDNVPQADVLDWDEDELPESVRSLGKIDAILMSDVTYNTDSFPALLSATSKLLQVGKEPPVILLGYKERDEAERSLWNMMENIGVRLEMIGLRRGFTDPPIEIWYGKYTSSQHDVMPIKRE